LQRPHGSASLVVVDGHAADEGAGSIEDTDVFTDVTRVVEQGDEGLTIWRPVGITHPQWKRLGSAANNRHDPVAVDVVESD
jgi:hypothetical protein